MSDEHPPILKQKWQLCGVMFVIQSSPFIFKYFRILVCDW